MKTQIAGLLVVASVTFAGCSQGTPGGPAATNSSKPLVGQADNTFKLSPPSMTIKQGETKATSISIDRGKNFDEDVVVKLTDVPKGITIDPVSPVIKHGDKDVKLSVKAADDAAIGSFVIKVAGHPAKGPDSANDFKLTVEKK